MSLLTKLSKYIKKNHPYIAQTIYEAKANYRIKAHKTSSIEERKKRLAELYKKYVGYNISWSNP